VVTCAETGSPPVVSVVVAVRGNVSALAGLLAALEEQDFSAGLEVVVVDNHTSARVPEGLLGSTIAHVVVHEPRAGLSRARNAGIRSARGEFIAITDPDSRPDRGWVRQLVEALERTKAYCAGGRVEPRFTALLSGSAPWRVREVLRLFVPSVWPGEVVGLEAPYWLVGCNLMFRRDPLPYFDDWLGVRGPRHLSCEDLEVVVRAQRDGLTVVVAPDAVVHRAIHPADVQSGALLRRAFWHGVSVARLVVLHPCAEIYDSDRFRDVIGLLRPDRWRWGMVEVARIAGVRAERIRLAVRGAR
jgi:cellulose synthase/poly-beta-1,6-N-acetylglucosamine synthase-like glycosyltransferase